MGAMSSATDERFQDVEKGMQQLHNHFGHLEANVRVQGAASTAQAEEIATIKAQQAAWEQNELARNAESERLRLECLQTLKELKDMKEEIKRDDISSPPGLSHRAASSTSTAVPTIPHELRTEAILSGLGHGATPEELLNRATEAFQRAAIPPEWHWDLAPNNRSTAIFVTFKDPASLRLAANKIRRAAISFQPGTRAWLDARRTKSENKPG
jgi:hypothetical protein